MRMFAISIKRWAVLTAVLCLGTAVQAQKNSSAVALMPYSPVSISDQKGNEWYVEQNGAIQRNSQNPSMISGSMTMQIGGQQFYCQQPMATPDGKEIHMAGAQPYNGIVINRRVRLLEREGGLRYLEEFTNTSGRDILLNVELRHNFNGQAKGYWSDTGRNVTAGLESGETGLLVQPNQTDGKTPALILVVEGAGSKIQTRLSARNPYQLTVVYSLLVPAGQTQSVLHAIGQLPLAANATAEDIKKCFRSFQLGRLLQELPRANRRQVVNLGAGESGQTLASWFPESFWGVTREASDVLVLDAASTLKGRASCRALTVEDRFGKREIPWERVAALAGRRWTQTDTAQVWLRDGQVAMGKVTLEDFKFTLINGAEMTLDLARLDRLVMAALPGEKAPVALDYALLELEDGSRWAFQPTGTLVAGTAWGELTVDWAETVAVAAPQPGVLGHELLLRDGSRLRILPNETPVSLQLRDRGAQTLALHQLRRAITPLAQQVLPDEADEPTQSFVELPAGQRLVGRLTTASLRLLTQSAPLELTPGSLRELRLLRDELTEADAPAQSKRLYHADLWGGGEVTGELENTLVRLEGKGYAWEVPARHLVRVVNPIPIMDNQLMHRLSQLLRQLGDAEWKTREQATIELREMGTLARGSLQEALKGATDPEVVRRLESLLQDLP